MAPNSSTLGDQQACHDTVCRDPERLRADRAPGRLHVWANSAGAGDWYGEGIHQVLFRLLSSFTGWSAVLYVQPDDRDVVASLFRGNPRVEIATIAWPWTAGPCPETRHRPRGRRGPGSILSKVRRRFGQRLSKLLRRAFSIMLRRKFRRAARRGEPVYFPIPNLAFDVGSPKGMVILSFWDNFVGEFPQFTSVREKLTARLNSVLARADVIITQSQANRRYLEGVLGICPDVIRVVELGGNDYAGLMRNLQIEDDDLGLGKEHTVRLLATWESVTPLQSRNSSQHLLELSVLYRLCESFKDGTRLLMVSTQDRPYKNIDRLLEIVDVLRSRGRDIKVAMTAVLKEDRRRRWTERFPWFVESVFEFPRLAPATHALLYRLADLVVHPSIVEGGPTPFPAYEAASLGTPALMQEGRHTRELFTRCGDDTRAFCVDLFDTTTAITRIEELLDDATTRSRNVQALLGTCDSWGDVAKRFEAALASGTPSANQASESQHSVPPAAARRRQRSPGSSQANHHAGGLT